VTKQCDKVIQETYGRGSEGEERKRDIKFNTSLIAKQSIFTACLINCSNVFCSKKKSHEEYLQNAAQSKSTDFFSELKNLL